MAQNQQSEISQQMRDMASKNIEQVRAAYKQFMDAMSKAQHLMETTVPPHPMTDGIKEVQKRAMKFTQQNLDASFSLAGELAWAKDLKEALQIQSRHAQLLTHAYALQAQELGGLVKEAAQKAKPGG